jgi:DNA-binding NtrC family response regulator
MTKVLVIDDDRAILNYIKIFMLQSGKYQAKMLQDSTRAFEVLTAERFDILLLDMDMPDVSGIDILKFIHENSINVVTIVLTGVEDIELAVKAMKLGTFEYLLKPIEEERLLQTLQAAAEKNKDNIELVESKGDSFSFESLAHKEEFKEIITQDKKMIKVFHYVEKFARTDNSVLIWGESGTGKELIARAIHKLSKRKDKKFVAINAGAFASDLFSTEFFGHTKGSFTGAIKDKKGFIEEANGGTLFLDEIGELSLPIQVKLLRVLQEEEFYRIGSTKNIKVDVRIIAATNKNLYDEISKGNFRKDLFFRLNINSIYLPPLYEREGDVKLLAEYFLKKYNKKYGKKVVSISNAVLKLLKSYSFPGNVREMMNLINSSIIVEDSIELRKKSLPNYFLENNTIKTDVLDDFIPRSIQEVEKNHIIKVLKYTGNNKTQAARILKISRVNLIAKIKKYCL